MSTHRFIRLLGIVYKLGLFGLCKTIYYNFKLLPFNQARHFPIFFSGKTTVIFTKRGAIEFTSDKLHHGMLSFGLSHRDASYYVPNFVKIKGKLIIHGEGNHDIAPGVTLTVTKSGILEIGNNFALGHFSKIIISSHSKIGDNNLHSWQNLYMDSDLHPILNSEGKRINQPKPIIIGDNVWIGAGCTILKGAQIPDGCIIGTSSLINKPLTNKKSIYVSSRLIKENVSWKLKGD